MRSIVASASLLLTLAFGSFSFAQDVEVIPQQGRFSFSNGVEALSSHEVASVYAKETADLQKFNKKNIQARIAERQLQIAATLVAKMKPAAEAACLAAGYKHASPNYTNPAMAAEFMKAVKPLSNSEKKYGVKKGGKVEIEVDSDDENDCTEAINSWFKTSSDKDGCLDSCVRGVVCCPINCGMKVLCCPCILYTEMTKELKLIVNGFVFEKVYCTNDEVATSSQAAAAQPSWDQ